MQDEEIVHEHLQGSLRADTRQTMARETTQAPMLLEVRKYDCDRLPSQSIHCLGFCRLHPCPVCDNRVCVFTTP